MKSIQQHRLRQLMEMAPDVISGPSGHGGRDELIGFEKLLNLLDHEIPYPKEGWVYYEESSPLGLALARIGV